MVEKLTLADVQAAFESADKFSCVPSVKEFPSYVITDVIDENQTVKWNREEVKRRMIARNEEIKKLKAIRKTKFDEAHQVALKFIMQTTGLPADKAEILWDGILTGYRMQLNIWEKLAMDISLFNRLRES